MPRFVLCHRHGGSECGVAFAAWKGFDSPLRHTVTVGACAFGDHRVWWTVVADDSGCALALLPPWVARRTEAVEVREITVP